MLSGEGGIEPPTRSLELTILPLNYSPYWLSFSLLSRYWLKREFPRLARSNYGNLGGPFYRHRYGLEGGDFGVNKG